MMNLRIFPFVLVGAGLISFGGLKAQEAIPSWTHFRGDHLNGISSATRVPLVWNDSVHIGWKTAIAGKGWSSPVVYGEQIWITAASGEGREMRAICVDFNTGDIKHDRILFNPDSLYRKHAVNTYATPTSAIESGAVYVHFGRYGTAALNTETGETMWERKDLQCEHIQGSGSSLFIYKDKLIVHMEGSDVHYIVALDKKSGETLWRTDRPKEVYDHLEYIGKKAYITPIVVNVNGRDLMISNGAAVCIAYDPETGKEVWRIVQGEDSTISMPTSSNGIVYFYTGFVTGENGKKYAELLAVDPAGEGDIKESHVLWRMKSPILQLLTPLVYDGLLYTVDSKALMSCMDALSGEIVWTHKLKGKYHSSPVYAGGYIYVSSTRGNTLVFKPGRTPLILSENSLEGEIWATPAITGDAIVMRTSEYLYKIIQP